MKCKKVDLLIYKKEKQKQLRAGSCCDAVHSFDVCQNTVLECIQLQFTEDYHQ